MCMSSLKYMPYNNLYRSLESQESNTDVSQIQNETKAVQGKTSVIIGAELEFLGFCL